MIATPQYQFVRVNEEGVSIPDCSTETARCLPLAALDDLKFQLVTGFPDEGDAISKIIAVPCNFCEDYSDQEILDMAFGLESKTSNGNGNDGGSLYISFATTWSTLQEGDYILLANGCTVDCTHDYSGIHLVTGYLESLGTSIVTLDTPFVGLIDNPGAVTMLQLSSAPHLITETSIALDDDTFFEGVNYLWNLSHPANASTTINFDDFQCFSLCLYRASQLGEFTDVECIGTTNCFQKISNECYTSKLVYGCNENAFDFYTDGTNPFEVSIRLPLYLHSPQFPGEEKGYQKSDGTYLKLAERVNKTWNLLTDYMPEEWHERLRMALSCDTIEITNENANLVDELIYKQDAYELDENAGDDNHKFPFWRGRTTVFKKLLSNSLNSNCV